MAVPLMNISMGVMRVSRRQASAHTLMLLQTIADGERRRPSDLASALGVHQSSVTRTLRTLADSGFVSSTVDPSDRRSWHVSLTESGAVELERLRTIGLDRFAEFVKDWDADDVAALGTLLSKLSASMTQAARPDPVTETH